MFELLKKSFADKVSISPDDLELLTASFSPKKLRKRQYLLQEGDVCNRLAFVERGTLISYSIDARGTQHVIQFAFEGWWIADLYSFFTREPSRLHIEALDDCELLLMDHAQHKQLLETLPAYERYTRILYQNAYVALQQRIEGTLGLSAEEKYLRLLDAYPDIINRVPLLLIASYIGVTPETLSRIRKQLMR